MAGKNKTRHEKVVEVLKNAQTPLSASEIARLASSRYLTTQETGRLIAKLHLYGYTVETIPAKGRYGERRYKLIGV